MLRPAMARGNIHLQQDGRAAGVELIDGR